MQYSFWGFGTSAIGFHGYSQVNYSQDLDMQVYIKLPQYNAPIEIP